VDAAHDNRKQLGQLMVDEGFLTLDQLTQALAEQNRSGRPLGKVLVDLGFVSEGAVANALAEQHGGLLKTEFGISAGLHILPSGSSLAPPAPEPPDRGTRIEQLESTLRTVVAERDSSARTADELKARLSEAAPDPAAAARVTELETQLQAVLTERNVLAQKLNARLAEPAPKPVPDPAIAARVVELEAQLKEVLAERNTFAEKLNELQARLSAVAQAHEAEITHVTDSAAARIDELGAELQAALAGRSALDAELQAALAARSELEAAVAELREQAERPQAVETPDEATGGRAHLLFVPSSSGYALIDFEGPDPPSGTLLDVDGVTYIVRRVGASPFPGDRLRCVYLDPV